jgi:hypothetical protein
MLHRVVWQILAYVSEVLIASIISASPMMEQHPRAVFRNRCAATSFQVCREFYKKFYIRML